MNRGKAALVTALVTLLLAAFTLMLARRNPITEVKAVALVDISGQHIAGFFQGLTPRPEFAASKMNARNLRASQASGSCGGSSSLSVLEKYIPWLAPKPVAAQGTCTPQPCTGSHWKNQYLDCSGNCTGRWDQVQNDINAPLNQGFKLSGLRGCNENLSSCPCTFQLCEMTTCTNSSDCPAGLRCQNGVCENYNCASGQAKCRSSEECPKDKQNTCVNGCCAPTTCTRLTDCAWGYYCTSTHICMASICGEQEVCHSDQDCLWKGPVIRCNLQNGCCNAVSPGVLDMEGGWVAACGAVFVQESPGLIDREVCVERQLRAPPDGLDGAWPERQVRDEVGVHDIEVDAIRAGCLDPTDGVAQVGQVGVEDARGDPRATGGHG